MPLPTARRRGMLRGMAKPLATLVSLLKLKRRWAQFSLGTLFVVSGWKARNVKVVLRQGVDWFIGCPHWS
jgi:hypothetical protein